MISKFKHLFTSKSTFKFKEHADTLCNACVHVQKEDAPVLYAQKNRGGEWLFHCGKDSHVEEQFIVLTLQQVAEIDPKLNGLYRMPEGARARRASKNSSWVPSRLS